MKNNMSRKKEDDHLPTIKSEFLPDEFGTGEASSGYSLEKEFSKSAKNKSHMTYGIVLLFVALMLILAFSVSWLLQNKYESLDVTSSEIQDLNLAELFDKAKQHEKNLTKARDELQRLRTARSTALQKATSEEERKRIAASYQNRIRGAEDNIANLQNAVDNYDVRLREATRKADEMINNYRYLADLQMSEQKKKFDRDVKDITLRYNPIFTDQTLNAILKDSSQKNASFAGQPENFDRVMADERIMTAAEYAELRRLTTNKDMLVQRMREVPYINSAGPSIQKIDELDRAVLSRYETTRQKMLNSIKDKNARLNSYLYAFDSYTQNQAEGGFVLDPRDARKIIVFVNPVYRIQTGDTATIYRSYDEIIGSIEFFYEGKTLMAKPLEITTGKSIKAMDKIIIQKRN